MGGQSATQAEAFIKLAGLNLKIGKDMCITPEKLKIKKLYISKNSTLFSLLERELGKKQTGWLTD